MKYFENENFLKHFNLFYNYININKYESENIQ